MQCPRCGNVIGAGAAFCPNCGLFLAAPSAANGGAAPVAIPAQRSNGTLWAILGTLLVVVALVFGLKAAGILQFGARIPDGRTLSAQGSGPVDTLGLRGTPPPTSLQQPHQNGPGMPDDVRRYLHHVERIEKAKNELESRMIAELQIFKTKLGTFEGAEGLLNHDQDLGGDGKRVDQETHDTFGDVKGRWEKIVTDFKSVDPPPQCVQLRDNYYRALSEVPGLAGDVADIMNLVQTDPASALQKAQGMQNKSSEFIDKYFGKADDDLGQICSIYNTSKWFDIKKDVGGGSLSLGGGL